MARTSASVDARTYLPDESQEAEIQAFVAAFERAGAVAPAQQPAIVESDGTRTEIPDSMAEALHQIARALHAGMGVNVAALNAMLTTQEAADFLGISRPTMVRILDRGEIPMERPGRHRYVRLSDVLSYQQRVREMRAESLDCMAVEAEGAGLYEATEGVPPPAQ